MKAKYVLPLTALIALFSCNPNTELDPGILYPAPERPSLIPGDQQIQVMFTAVSNAESYEIRYGTVDDAAQARALSDRITTETKRVTAYIPGLVNGRVYYVWSKAFFKDGVSEYSESASASPLPPPPPLRSAPTVSSDDEALDLSWNPIAEAEGYVIYYSSNAVLDAQAGQAEASGTTALIEGLVNNRTYYVWITAKNTAGESAPSPRASGTPRTPSSPPDGPAKPSVKTGDAKLTVVWNAVKRAKTYILYYNTQDNRDSAIQWSEEIDRAAGTLSARITGLANETQYYVWVEAKNSAGTRVSPSAYEIPHAKRPLNFNNPNTVIGTASARFPNEEAGKGDRLSRKQETAFGDLVCESMTAWARSNGHAVDFAFINGGVIQGAIPKGSITIGMLNTLLYGDQLSIVTLRGNKVQELFEYVASIRHTGGGGSGTGAFGQVSKEVRYTINYTYSADHINGVLENFTIGGSAVDPNRNYTFITSTYLVDGGDGYGAYLLSDLHVPTGLTLYKAVAEYIYDQDMVPLVPATDGRIVLIGAVWTGAQ